LPAFALGHAKTPLDRAGATSRRHHLNPAEAHGALAGERSKPVRLAVRDHTDALLAGKIQPKMGNGVARLAAAGSSLDRPKIAAIPAISRASMPARDP